jgi:hypothetical protein
MAVLEHAIREDLNKRALRRLAVLRPDQGRAHELSRRQNRGAGRCQQSRRPRRGRAQNSFRADALHRPGGFHGESAAEIFPLRPGGEVRLKYAYIIKCDEVVKDAAGNVIELRCTADLESKTGGATAGRKIKGTIHWVSAAHAVDAEVRLYDRLFTVPEPDAAGDFKQHLNPHSLEILTAKCEPSLQTAAPEACAINSSASVTSRWTRTARPGSWSSIAPSLCATPGPRRCRRHEARQPGRHHAQVHEKGRPPTHSGLACACLLMIAGVVGLPDDPLLQPGRIAGQYEILAHQTAIDK